MKPVYRILFNRTASAAEDSSLTQKIQERVSSCFEGDDVLNIIESPTSYFVTIVIEPQSSFLKNTTKCKGNLYISMDKELEGDHDMYVLLLKFSSLSFPEEYPVCLINISVKNDELTSNPTNSEQSREQAALYTAKDPKWNISDIVLSDDILKRLRRAASIIENKEIIMNDFEFNRVDKSLKSIICLYGPPGTGKTITAQAIAAMLNKKIIMSSYAQIESKYVGEGAKNLRSIFKAATEQDAVLFMDEADSFLSKRIESTDSSSDKHYNRMSNELFQLLEEHNGCVVFATNLLTDLDNAFKSRIVDSIYFPLPDKETRVRILRSMVPCAILDSVCKTEKEIEDLSNEIDGFSGRDIRKSLLLSYADAAVEKKNNPNFEWTYNLFYTGFNDVKKSFSEDSVDLPIEEVQKFEDDLKLRHKKLELAKHAIYVDGNDIDEREKQLLNELSIALINREITEDTRLPKYNLNEICSTVEDETTKQSLIDIAVRVVTIDGDFSEKEQQFLRKICSLLGYNDEQIEQFKNYALSMAQSYKLWINACKK